MRPFRGRQSWAAVGGKPLCLPRSPGHRAHSLLPPALPTPPGRLQVEGSGFLYKQVRHMTGALLAVGQGQITPDAIVAALDAGAAAGHDGPARHAARAWTVAEAKGLCLERVEYAPATSLPLPLLLELPARGRPPAPAAG